MSNKSLFLQALEQLDDAETKLADLNAIYHRAPMIDPLDNPTFAPDGVEGHVTHGRNIGRLIGGLGGAALGGWAGSHLGNPFDFANPVAGASELVGGAAGAIGGGLAGHGIGGAIGGGVARMTSTPEQQAVEHIKKLDPASGLAHIRMSEQSGRVSPTVIQAMKDTYNTRRSGIQTQLGAGVAVPPGKTPVHVVPNKPEALPV